MFDSWTDHYSKKGFWKWCGNFVFDHKFDAIRNDVWNVLESYLKNQRENQHQIRSVH